MLNLCLGLKNKKLLVKKLLEENDIDILCMQETQVRKDIDHKELNISKFLLELESNTKKSRIGVYISKTINYVRRTDLEGLDSNLIIIDLEDKSKTRIINVYRSFSPEGGISQRDKFKYQLSIIKKSFHNVNCILLRDFNLNSARCNDVN